MHPFFFDLRVPASNQRRDIDPRQIQEATCSCSTKSDARAAPLWKSRLSALHRPLSLGTRFSCSCVPPVQKCKPSQDISYLGCISKGFLNLGAKLWGRVNEKLARIIHSLWIICPNRGSRFQDAPGDLK